MDVSGEHSPWGFVKIGFARKAACRVLASQPKSSSDAVDELTSAVLSEVCEVAARGIVPTKRVYRLAALHCARELWWRKRQVTIVTGSASDDDPEWQDPEPPVRMSDGEECLAISLLSAARLHAAIDGRSRDVLSAYLAGATVTDICEARGETFAAVDTLLTRLLRHMRDGTVPAFRGAKDKGDGLSCLDCGTALAVPAGRGGIPVRCKSCAKNRRRAKDHARHTDPSRRGGTIAA